MTSRERFGLVTYRSFSPHGGFEISIGVVYVAWLKEPASPREAHIVEYVLDSDIARESRCERELDSVLCCKRFHNFCKELWR